MSTIRASAVPSQRAAGDTRTIVAGAVSGKSPETVADRPALPSRPVFLDTSGRRRRRLRCFAYGLGLAGMVYAGLVAASVVGDPVQPEDVLPFIDATYRPEQISPDLPPTPGPSVPDVTASASAGSEATPGST